MNHIFNLFRRKHKAAFTGELLCPFCQSPNQKVYERPSPYVIRYQCKKCGSLYRYGTEPEGFHGPGVLGTIGHPYGTYPHLQHKMDQAREERNRPKNVLRRKSVRLGGQEYKIDLHKFKL